MIENETLMFVLSTFGMTIGVLVLAYFCLSILKRFQHGFAQKETTSALSYERSIVVGPKERVTVISFQGERFMLGVSAGGVSLLARFEGDLMPENEGDNVEPPADVLPLLKSLSSKLKMKSA